MMLQKTQTSTSSLYARPWGCRVHTACSCIGGTQRRGVTGLGGNGGLLGGGCCGCGRCCGEVAAKLVHCHEARNANGASNLYCTLLFNLYGSCTGVEIGRMLTLLWIQ